ncbi:hypothetical protein BDV59DRAFT_178700 [Aspergillus ambiguus]|uniref:uncharacterized protein n=1 Tax=Aspergillus ambiguus TaxID=176160 RepID=UPI003CCD41BA
MDLLRTAYLLLGIICLLLALQWVIPCRLGTMNGHYVAGSGWLALHRLNNHSILQR